MIARRNRSQMRAFATATEERLPSGTPADSMLEQYKITARPCRRVFALFLGLGLFVTPVAAQQNLDDKYPQSPTTQVNAPSKTERLGRLPIEWLIGPYIPVQEQLETLSNAQRGKFMFGRRSSPPDLMWQERFQLDLTRRVVNLPIGAEGLTAMANATR